MYLNGLFDTNKYIYSFMRPLAVIILLSFLNYTCLDIIKKIRVAEYVNTHSIIKPVKVFQIGFSKCATVTLAAFFGANGVRAIHHDTGRLAVSIYNNHLEHKPLITRKYKPYYVYTDMEKIYSHPIIEIGPLLFKELDKQYPGSKFILNTRDKQAWLKSRARHKPTRDKIEQLDLSAQLTNTSRDAVLAQWSKDWDEHHAAVIEYFKDRPQDLLVFNIDTDPPEKISEFFQDYFRLDPRLYPHINKTDGNLVPH